ncbi:MAG: acyl-CoA carboxylase subunit beta, partial [Halobacteria archaeon]|nr:acyl-CoA carboxylase subunit beta [Halobacteria archaeon]
MDIQLKQSATEQEAEAIASALVEYLEERVSVYVGNSDDPVVELDYEDGEYGKEKEVEPDQELGPTEREEELWEEIEDIKQGGPQKYKDRLPEQGKLFVRDRLELWFG